MRSIPIGSSGIEASTVGIGTWAAGGGDSWSDLDDKQSIDAIHAAIDHGVTLIDTAPSYGFGRSEEVVGKAIKGRRDQVAIATKCGVWWDDDRGSPLPHKDGRDTYLSLRPDTIVIEVENSLRRLGVEHIDLFQCHKPAVEPENTPIAETMDCLMDLKAQGKIRAIGVSNVSLEQLETYDKAGELASNQLRYSMICRDSETDILPYCEANDIGVLTFWSLEYGLLTGKVGMDRVFDERDFRKLAGEWLPWYKLENRQRLLDLFEGWSDLTREYACSLTQLVIAWTAAQPGVSHVLFGAKSVEQAAENAFAGTLELEAADIQRMHADLNALGDPA